ncbi:chemotaxis protein CheW [Desulfovirgula thermocuniculi]|uniref:chemotaxis protein CheW n=1 Tax=Desulfovirgula thermocuniculi TaxID=348842 RepID=UPI0003F5D582|nr:chemotaxis protein CheW [Desulfovirgula thermocuniculi]
MSFLQRAVSEIQLVVFRLKGQTYALDIRQVLEITRPATVVAVPGAPWFVEGITNLRGQVIPVISLARRLGLEDGSGESAASRALIVEAGGVRAGLLVDEVAEVLRVSQDSVKPPPSLVVGAEAAYLQGVVLAGEELVILLDAARIFRPEEVEVLKDLAQG